jgi:hypothetical protein
VTVKWASIAVLPERDGSAVSDAVDARAIGYPTRHAAFVNLARQIFIENDLCLLGFSGNDPNFLEWAGWVRDQLGGSARRIYLVGYLSLSVSSRRYLEAHNIAPIDFAPLVNDLPSGERHAAAAKLFFDALRAEQPVMPHEWKQHPPSDFPLGKGGPDLHKKVRTDEKFAAEALDEMAKLLREDRENYPGWLVCPRSERQAAHYGYHEYALLKPSVLAQFKAPRRAEILHEFLWRYTVSFADLHITLRDALVAIMEEPTPPIERPFRLQFAVALMRDARIEGNDAGLKKWGNLVDEEAAPEAPERLEAQYHRCLRLRDCLDLDGLAKALGALNSEDSVWRLRRAGLYTEVGEYAKATKLIKDATAELEKAFRLDRNSIWIKSCLAWASWLRRVADMGNFRRRGELPRARDFRELNIDPPGELEALENAADHIRRKEQEDDAAIIPLFDAGSYRRGSSTMQARPGDPGFELLHELDQLMEVVGVPMRINHVQIAAGAAINIMKVTYHHSLAWYVWLFRALHSHFDNPFIRYFGRVAIAQLPGDVADSFRQHLDATISFWCHRLKATVSDELADDRSIAVDELRLVLVAQSRMTVRMPVEEAIRAFQRGTEIVSDSSVVHHWLIEVAGELAKYALKAIPVSRQGALALKAMEFPLACERGGYSPNWPDIARAITDARPERDIQNPRWDHRVQRLLDAAAPSAPCRREAIDRLAYLSMHDVLKPNEQEAFATALWGKVDNEPDALPAETNLLVSMIAKLPSPPGIDAAARASARIFGRDLAAAMRLSGPMDIRDLIREVRPTWRHGG